jgi:tetratricopeptide (TPR) repeat protein
MNQTNEIDEINQINQINEIDQMNQISLKRLLFSLLILIASAFVAYHILCIWRGMALSQKAYTREGLLEAARIEPSNPDPFHKLGVLHQWNLLQVDLNAATQYFRKAIEKNPLEQEYWLNLARIFQRMGEAGAFERALENAILVFPSSYRGRWVAGNLLLQQGALERALPHFAYILSNYPNQSGLVYDIWSKAVDDPDFILERLIPGDPSSLNQYLTYLYGTRDTKSARKAWAKLASLGHKADRAQTIRHIDFLISRGELTEAVRVWKARLREEGLPLPSDGNTVTNGGFERKKVLGGGFDWRIGTVSGTEVSLDHSDAFEGNSSLKIAFNGKENVDFHHVYQYVALKPNTDYLLEAHMKTEGVTTKSGLKIEVLGLGPAFYRASESLTGDNGWRELRVPFRTPAHSQGGMIRVRRAKTDKFDRFIAGTVWVFKSGK